MTLRLHPIVANLVLLGASVVVALGATELVLRLAPGLLSEEARLRLSWQEQKLSHAARTRPDSVIGFLYVPDGHDQVRQGTSASPTRPTGTDSATPGPGRLRPRSWR